MSIKNMKLEIGDVVYVSRVDQKEIVETKVVDIIERDGKIALIEGRYMYASYFFPPEAMSFSLRDACVDFGINVIHPYREFNEPEIEGAPV